MKKFLGIMLFLSLGVLGLGVTTLFANESTIKEESNDAFEKEKSHIMEEVYMNPDFLPLVDVKKAKEKIGELSKSFQQLADRYSARDDKKDELDTEYQDVYVTLEYIVSDIERTKKKIIKTLTKITFSKKKISELKESVLGLKDEINTSKKHLSKYTVFLFRLNNDFYGHDRAISDIKLFVKSDNIAKTLSEGNLVHMLTIRLDDLLGVLRKKQVKYIKSIIQLNKVTLSYQSAVKILKKNFDTFTQQKKHFKELLGYLQVSKDEAEMRIGTLQQSKSDLEEQLKKLKSITNTSAEPLLKPGTKAYALLSTKDKENGERYLSRPILPMKHVNYSYHDIKYLNEYKKEYEGVDMEVEQLQDIYAPAPGIVYKVHDTEDIDLNWMVIIHKYGYMTLYKPLYDVSVKPGDIVKRGQIIARAGGKVGTRGSGLKSKYPHLSFEVLKNGEPVDPYTVMDISIFTEDTLPQQYKIKYLNDYFARNVDLSSLLKVSGETIEERRDDWLRRYASGPYRNASLRYDASDDTGINPIFGLCVGFAETSYKNFKSKNNIGNVGNNDRGDTVEYGTPLSGVKALFNVLNNKYLGGYNTINELSRFGNDDGYIYASSPYNRQKNIMKCMSTIYGYPVQEDLPIRVRRK